MKKSDNQQKQQRKLNYRVTTQRKEDFYARKKTLDIINAVSKEFFNYKLSYEKQIVTLLNNRVKDIEPQIRFLYFELNKKTFEVEYRNKIYHFNCKLNESQDKSILTFDVSQFIENEDKITANYVLDCVHKTLSAC